MNLNKPPITMKGKGIKRFHVQFYFYILNSRQFVTIHKLVKQSSQPLLLYILESVSFDTKTKLSLTFYLFLMTYFLSYFSYSLPQNDRNFIVFH
jgi:hypothetical protein